MSSISKRILLMWGLLIAFSAFGFAYLSSRPNMMLWVESAHPSNAYLRGRELKDQGHLEEALSAFRQGRQYFQQIAQQTNLRKHRIQYLQGFLEMASVYELYGDPQSLREAIDLYSQAIEIDPSYADGQPAMQKGLLLQGLNQYLEARDAFTVAIEKGGAYVALESLFGRGTCYFELGDTQRACDDWAQYVRYKKEIPESALENLSSLSIQSCTDALYIRARAAMDLGNSEQSIQFLKQYLVENPGCRGAQFYYHRFIDQSHIDFNANLTPKDFFPPVEGISYPIISALLDLYADSKTAVELILDLSMDGDSAKPPQLQIDRNHEPIGDIVVLSSQVDIYTIPFDLEPGMNPIHFHTLPDPALMTVTPILLHSLTVRRKLPE